MPRFRKRPVEVEAVQYHAGDLFFGICDCPCLVSSSFPPYPIHVHTREGPLYVLDGDWVITGIQGEKYPCKPDIFQMTYEPLGPEEPDTLPEAAIVSKAPGPSLSVTDVLKGLDLVLPGNVPPSAPPAALEDTVAIKSEVTGQIEHIARVKPRAVKPRTGNGLRVTVKRFVVVNGMRMIGPSQVYENVASVEDKGEMFVLNTQVSSSHALSPIYLDKAEIAGMDTE